MRRSLLGVSCLALLTAGQAHAADDVDARVGYGLLAQSCGHYIEQRRSPNRTFDSMAAQWADGFLTGYNTYSAQTGTQVKTNALDGPTILAYLDQYCREHPLATASLGLEKLVNLYKGRY